MSRLSTYGEIAKSYGVFLQRPTNAVVYLSKRATKRSAIFTVEAGFIIDEISILSKVNVSYASGCHRTIDVTLVLKNLNNEVKLVFAGSKEMPHALNEGFMEEFIILSIQELIRESKGDVIKWCKREKIVKMLSKNRINMVEVGNYLSKMTRRHGFSKLQFSTQKDSNNIATQLELGSIHGFAEFIESLKYGLKQDEPMAKKLEDVKSLIYYSVGSYPRVDDILDTDVL